MVRGEVASVIGVQDLWDAADNPTRILFTPDRLTQCQGCVQGGRRFERKEISGDSAAVVVDDDAEPRLGGRSVWTDQPNIEWRVVSLPDRIGTGSLAPMDQLKCFTVSFRAFMGEGYKVRAQTADDVEDGSVARSSFVQIFGETQYLAVERSNGERRLL
jgi:hypothetical protein